MKIDYTQLAVRQPDSGDDRARPAGRRTRGNQQDAHSRYSHSAQDVARHYGPEETAPSKTDLNKQIDEKLRANGRPKLERGHREAAQLQELRDTLSDGTPEQQALSHRDVEHEPHPGSKSRTSWPDTWWTLDERRPEDLSGRSITAAHASVDSRGETRTKLEYVLGYTQQQRPRSNVFILCEQLVDIESSNDKKHGSDRLARPR